MSELPINTQKPVNMQAIADRCKVSISTVSRALRGDNRVAKKTVDAIQKAAAEIGYRPNPFVSALMTQLRTSRPTTFKTVIALIDTMPSVDAWKDFAVQRAFNEGAEIQAELLGFKIERFWANEKAIRRERLTNILMSRGIQGILLPPWQEYSASEKIMPVDHKKFTCVCVGHQSSEHQMFFATNDQYSTARLGHTQLIEQGYKKTGLAVEAYIERILEQRFSGGFIAALEARQLRYERASILRYKRADARKQFEDWFKRYRPEAICVVNPEIRNWLEDMGYRVPEDIGLASLDWEGCMEDWTGVNQDNKQVGMAAVNLLVRLLEGNQYQDHASHPYGIMTEGFWVDGKTTLRRQKRGKSDKRP